MAGISRLFRFRHLDGLHDRWAEIDRYHACISESLPSGAKQLALAAWHYDASDPRCPHDAWLESVELRNRDRQSEIRDVRLRLLGAYHDRKLCFDYWNVRDFSVEGQFIDSTGRDRDWLFDEVHLLESRRIEHIIAFEACEVRIKCEDLTYSYQPIEGRGLSSGP